MAGTARPELSQVIAAGIAHHRAGRLAEAAATYQEVLASDPDNFEALCLLGAIAHSAGRHHQTIDYIGRAIAHAERATPARPPNAYAYSNLGEAYRASGQTGDAMACYEKAVAIKPDYAEAYNDRGFAYYLKGDFERAISDYTRAIELRPNYPKAYNSRGVAYMQGGYGRAKSVPDFDRAIELKPDFRYAYINRANARLIAHPLLAIQDFHRAGMHPERALAVVACVFLLFALAITLLVLRRRRIRESETSGPA